MGIQVKSYMTVRPPEIPGMEIASATVQIETPAAADSGELADRRLVELREQREALIAARRQEHILENRVKAAETAADDPRSALDYALADGRMTEQECLERLQQTDPFGERAGRSELEEAINLLQQMLAERGHLDPYREDIEELVGRVRGLAAAQPGVSGIQGAPTQGGVEVQRADLNVSADMPSHVHVGRVVSAACRLSRAEIETAAGKARDEGRVSADAARLITLEVLPKVNAEVVGEDRAAVPVPGKAGPVRRTSMSGLPTLGHARSGWSSGRDRCPC